MKHPIYLSDVVFDSWTTLCEHSVDFAKIEAEKQMLDAFLSLVEKISDEIVYSVEETDGA